MKIENMEKAVKLGIADNRRVQGLGCRQRDLIIEFVEKVK